VIWVYAICERSEAPLPRDRGLAQAALEGVPEGDLVGVISRHVDPLGDPALDALLVHERVIEGLMADRAVLPMRFGARLGDDDALRAVLAARRQEFLATLDRVRGRVEVGVRALRHGSDDDEIAAEAPGSGRAYLEAKLRTGRRVEHEAAAVHEPLARLAVAASRRPARRPEELLRASYLLDAAVVARFRAMVERLQRANPRVAILCTGPWPTYSFVAGAATLTTAPVAGAWR
jgi:hypothetical protein